MSVILPVRDSRLKSLFNALAGDAIRKNEAKSSVPNTRKENLTSAPSAGEADNSGTLIKSEAWVLDLKLSFSPEALQKTLDTLKEGRKAAMAGSGPADSCGTAPAAAGEILTAGFSADGVREEKTKSVEGSGGVREINTYEYRKMERRTKSDYRIDRIKLSIARREREEIEARFSVTNRNGYRIVYRSISQRYEDNLSLKAELLRKFTASTAAVEANAPDSTGAFIETTGRMAKTPRVTGKTISAFFDAVEAHFDASRASLHAKIDTFLERLTKDLNLNEDEMKQAGKLLHERVDSFFGEVNRILNGMEKANIAAVEMENSAGQAESQPMNSEMENPVVNVS